MNEIGRSFPSHKREDVLCGGATHRLPGLGGGTRRVRRKDDVPSVLEIVGV